MEIEGEDGTKLFLKTRVKAVFGRGAGFNTEDLTVSRRHVSLEFKPSAAGTERSDRVSFEVLGRNPVWVITGKKIQTLRKSETVEIAAGDRFCVSGNLPIWFTLKRRDEVMEERALDHGEIELDIDPVKEFGFLVIGKEFDQYPKSRVRDIKQWEWFLEDSTNRNSDDDEDGDKKVRKGLGKKRGRKNGNEDDDWSVESDEDKELMVKSKRVVTPTYSTRSKKTKKDINASSTCSGAQTKQRGRVDVEDDDDETLGGFIVSEEEANLEEEDDSDIDDDEEDEDEDEE
ncbi:SMAD/FHA domain superfamily [Arabidopsis thaliana x Arabidopsis arenosa]|uniref:SMAD/FHA domain superfamily n=1 Tax=Arabidopsis thaliana x Arabidopsis arenosa TaxID=1240361 RepID=A0A8T2AT75_9BRAS|nr:SMAD/FHA domain superfamily [Arabidopsis thaliana x Arabidopsis arenosa]